MGGAHAGTFQGLYGARNRGVPQHACLQHRWRWPVAPPRGTSSRPAAVHENSRAPHASDACPQGVLCGRISFASHPASHAERPSRPHGHPGTSNAQRPSCPLPTCSPPAGLFLVPSEEFSADPAYRSFAFAHIANIFLRSGLPFTPVCIFAAFFCDRRTYL